MKIPEDQLESTKECLRHLVDERTSAPWASYSGDDLAIDEQDYEDIEHITTVLDVFLFLRDQGRREYFVEYASCLDPLGSFKVSGKEWPDEDDEEAFRDYLSETYGIKKSEFY
jgi:hypothetical protein